MRAWKASGAALFVAAFGIAALLADQSAEAQPQSRLYEVTKNKKLRVCQYPLYYSISFRNPKSGHIEGIDADLAKELAKELDAQL
jgi:cyclohexadienyl dehydratase